MTDQEAHVVGKARCAKCGVQMSVRELCADSTKCSQMGHEALLEYLAKGGREKPPFDPSTFPFDH